MWLILGLILIGMVAGWIAERVVYPEWKIDWTEAFIVGLAGSFLGGLLGSLIAGDGFDLLPAPLIGSTICAIILLAIVKFVRNRIREAGK